MRFDTPIYFQTITPGTYDEESENYGPATVSEEMRFASVTDTGADTVKLIYGDLKQKSFTVRLQNHYTAPFDAIRIGEKVYKADVTRKLRSKQTFIVSEVQ